MLSVFGCDMTSAEVKSATACLESQWIGMGREVSAFEEEFSAARGLNNFVMCDSGSNALYLALRALELPQGSEVIVPSFTWIACATSVLLAGLKPIFCDVDPVSMNIRATDVEANLSDKTAAIMVVHYAGLPVQLDDIRAFNIPIVEDCAHAVDSDLQGAPCGSTSDAAIFSFDAVKNLAVGEGGGVAFFDPEHADKARALRYCGIAKSGFEAASSERGLNRRWWEYQLDDVAPKMLPNDIAASIGRVQLRRLPELQARRKRLWNHYDLLLEGLPMVVRPQGATGTNRHSYFTYSVQVPERDALARYLLDRNIYTTLRYQPLHQLPAFGQQERVLPNADMLNERALSLPLHPRMDDSDVELVTTSMREFYSV